ncbi:MAG: tRNA dihydrouridine synthase DusB [Muribaculaceae bacterium]|nr:tRNA dihydrouridine synthase DusB [Muribaculaceae bacterium]
MKIGTIDLGSRPVVLAPMEDVTDPSFRLICKEQGAAMVYTEFVSSEALVRDIPSTVRKLQINDEERPVVIQIYGRDPEAMVEAARIVERANPDLIDINFGCPVKKVAGKGAGAGMLRDIPKLLSITEKVVKAVSTPVTVKTRLGWDCENKIIGDLAPRLQDCGIAALTVHGRTRSQMYTGEADWNPIGALKADSRIEIPIIGNGDITTPEKALDAFETYKVDGIMVGRGAIGAPWIFHEIKHFFETGEKKEVPVTEKFGMLMRQIRESIKSKDERRGILHIRRHLAATPLLKGLPDFRPLRIKMLRADTLEQLADIFEEIQTIYFPEE